MSYPEPRYHGASGEQTATFRPADHAPEVTYPTGNTAHYLATGASTYGRPGDAEAADFYVRHDNVWVPDPT